MNRRKTINFKDFVYKIRFTSGYERWKFFTAYKIFRMHYIIDKKKFHQAFNPIQFANIDERRRFYAWFLKNTKYSFKYMKPRLRKLNLAEVIYLSPVFYKLRKRKNILYDPTKSPNIETI